MYKLEVKVQGEGTIWDIDSEEVFGLKSRATHSFNHCFAFLKTFTYVSSFLVPSWENILALIFFIVSIVLRQ
jgi:hypothetical protein